LDYDADRKLDLFPGVWRVSARIVEQVMSRNTLLLLVIAVLLWAGAPLPYSAMQMMGLSAGTAMAQSVEKPKRKNLLELLFGQSLMNKRDTTPKANVGTSNAKRITVTKRVKNDSATANTVTIKAAPPVVMVEKRTDAAKILVVGDFMADQLSQGLRTMFAENPGIEVVNGAVALSGMVRDDVQDWPNKIAELVESTKPVIVVALVGMNDRQQIRTSEGKFNKLTEEWKTEYLKRTDLLARNIREKRVPMIWVGLPPVSKGNMNTDYLVFNGIYRSTVESYGGMFVDVWDGFTDDQGKYVRSGPDLNGQIVALRRTDGINMTDSGEEKLAFYTEKAIKRMTGFGKDALISEIALTGDLSISNEPQYDPVGTGKTIVIALGGPAADGGSVLEGVEGYETATDAKLSSSFDLVTNGLPVQPKEGRIDKGWGQPSFDLGKVETPEPVLANMRGYSLKALFEELPPLEDIGEQPISE
jgi:hypothetical protein